MRGSAAADCCNHAISNAAVAKRRTVGLLSYGLGEDKVYIVKILRGGIFGHGPGGNVRQPT